MYKNHYLINDDVIVLIIEMDAKSGLLMLLWSYKRVPNVVGVESKVPIAGPGVAHNVNGSQEVSPSLWHPPG